MSHETLIIVLVSVCLIVNLVTLVVVFLFYKSMRAVTIVNNQVSASLSKEVPPVQGIVFCRNCGNQFDSILDVCPHCNRAR
jgi:hypothetical protein